MSLNRMPLFCFAFSPSRSPLLFALPSLSVAALFLELDRMLGFHFYDAAHGGDAAARGSTCSGSSATPRSTSSSCRRSGIVTSIIPTFARRRMVGFPLVALSEILVAFLGFGVWVHHMFADRLRDR